jgi:hypothetical protein
MPTSFGSEAWHDVVRHAAGNHGHDPLLVVALVYIESGGNTWALRYERDYRWLYDVEHFVRTLRLHPETERTQQRTSWGLLQVMGAVARERGCLDPYLSVLCQPAKGLEYALRQLDWLRDVKGYRDDALVSAYNQGSDRRLPDGLFANQRYVDKVRSKQVQLGLS